MDSHFNLSMNLIETSSTGRIFTASISLNLIINNESTESLGVDKLTLDASCLLRQSGHAFCRPHEQ